MEDDSATVNSAATSQPPFESDEMATAEAEIEQSDTSEQLKPLTDAQPVVAENQSGQAKRVKRFFIIGILKRLSCVRSPDTRHPSNLEKQKSHVVKESSPKKADFTVRIPNVTISQMKYLDEVVVGRQPQNQMKSFVADPANKSVRIQAHSNVIRDIYKTISELVTVSAQKDPLFLNVLRSLISEQLIKQQLLLENIVSTWTIENVTVFVCSENAELAQRTLKIIEDLIWEQAYPCDHTFDDEEKQLLKGDRWKEKKSQLQKAYRPFEILSDRKLGIFNFSGLSHHKADVLSELSTFFATHITSIDKVFEGAPGKTLFIRKFKKETYDDLGREFNVSFNLSGTTCKIIGTRHNIASAERQLVGIHDSICEGTHVVEHPASIQHIKEECDTLLEQMGVKASCLIQAPKNPSSTNFQLLAMPSRGGMLITPPIYSVILPSGATIEVQKGDITTIACDAIVSGANVNLDHGGGLARAIVHQGGQCIQDECANYVRMNGPLKEGQVVSVDAGTLPSKKVIYAAGPPQNSSFHHKRTLRECIDNCFNEAERHHLESIAIPPICTGVFGYPLAEAIQTLVNTIVVRENQLKHLPHRIVFIDNKDDSLKMFQDELTIQYGEPSSDHQVTPSPQHSQKNPGTRASVSKINEATLTLQIFANAEADIQLCKQNLSLELQQMLKTFVWSKNRKAYKAEWKLIEKLTTAQIDNLQRDARAERLQFHIDQSDKDVTIVGEPEKVDWMVYTVLEKCQTIEDVQWELKYELGEWHEYPKVINKRLEEEYYGEKHPASELPSASGTGVAMVDFATMSGTDQKGRFQLQRHTKGFPSTWVQPLDSFQEVIVNENTEEYESVKKAFTQSLAASGARISQVLRIQHPTLHQQYMIQLKRVARRLNWRYDEAERAPLWHGTSEDTVSKIASGKFDRGFTGKNAAMYGNGTYFARDSSYSARDTYSPPNASGEKYIIQSRVITGEWVKGKEGLKAPPHKPASPAEQYDSTVNNLSDPSIFVVFDDTAAYPEYIIKFRMY